VRTPLEFEREFKRQGMDRILLKYLLDQYMFFALIYMPCAVMLFALLSIALKDMKISLLIIVAFTICLSSGFWVYKMLYMYKQIAYKAEMWKKHVLCPLVFIETNQIERLFT
jgi:hypothetical protein